MLNFALTSTSIVCKLRRKYLLFKFSTKKKSTYQAFLKKKFEFRFSKYIRLKLESPLMKQASFTLTPSVLRSINEIFFCSRGLMHGTGHATLYPACMTGPIQPGAFPSISRFSLSLFFSCFTSSCRVNSNWSRFEDIFARPLGLLPVPTGQNFYCIIVSDRILSCCNLGWLQFFSLSFSFYRTGLIAAEIYTGK